jgi:hypothetical protein
MRTCLRCGESELTHPEPMDPDAALLFGECPRPEYPAPALLRGANELLSKLLGTKADVPEDQRDRGYQ